jgi:hypothetical protein
MKVYRLFVIWLLVAVYFSLRGGVLTVISQGNTATPAPTTADLPTRPAVDIAATATRIARTAHLTITSPDRQVTLLIPRSALPAGVAASAIKITSLEPSDDSVLLDGQPPLLTYQMEPDGLQFKTPGLIRVEIDKPSDGRIPVLAMVSGQEINPLNPTRVELNATKPKMTLIAPIAHFSSVVVAKGRYHVRLEISGSNYKVIGDTISATANVVRGPIELKPDGDNTPQPIPPSANNSLWAYEGTWLASSGIAPTILLNAPKPSYTDRPEQEQKESFSCSTVSQLQTITYLAELGYPVFQGPIVLWEDLFKYTLRVEQEIAVTSEPFSCNNLVRQFMAKFVGGEYSTYYTVDAFDPDGQPLTYEWSKTNGCGGWRTNPTSPEAVWIHPHTNHAGDCPDQPFHPGTITVVVKSKLGALQRVEYFGGSKDGKMVPKSSK